MKTWEIAYKGHEIRVENRAFSGERLVVDGEVQDERKGFAFRSRLLGKIRSGEGSGESIKVSLGGWFAISCSIFVDEKLIGSGRGQYRFQ